MLELRPVLKAIVAREAAQQLAVLPVVDDPGDAFACNAGHGGEVDLPDLLTDDDSSRPDFLPEVIRQLEHRSGHPAFERKEATGCHCRVCLAQASSEKPDQRFVELECFFVKASNAALLRKLTAESRTATTDAERGSPSRTASSPTMAPLLRKARMRSAPELETIVTLRSPDAITAVAGIAGPEQHPTGAEPHQF